MAFEGGGFTRASSSRSAGPASYQNAAAGEASAWAGVVTQVEDELRRFTALSAQLKKSVDLVGSARDSEEVRQRIAAALARGKESVDGISALLRTKLAEAAGKEEAGLSAKDRAARKTQQQRFEKDWLTVSSAYKDVRGGRGQRGGARAQGSGGPPGLRPSARKLLTSPTHAPALLLSHPLQTLGQWQEKSRKHPAPAKSGGASGGAGASKQKYPSVGSSSATSSKAEEEASCVATRCAAAAGEPRSFFTHCPPRPPSPPTRNHRRSALPPLALAGSSCSL